MLQSLGLQRVGHNLATEQQHIIMLLYFWTSLEFTKYYWYMKGSEIFYSKETYLFCFYSEFFIFYLYSSNIS